jgi:hypothetical protein
MINVIPLPWVSAGKIFRAHTLYGTVILRPLQEPWIASGFRNPLAKPRLGWGIFLKDKRVGWTFELKDAAHYATAFITKTANERFIKGDGK